MNLKGILIKWYSSRSLLNKICIWIIICLTFICGICSVIFRNGEYLTIIGGLWIGYVLFYFLLKGEVNDIKERWKSIGFILKSYKDSVKNKKEKKNDDPFL